MHITQQYILIKIYVYISSRLNVTINVTVSCQRTDPISQDPSGSQRGSKIFESSKKPADQTVVYDKKYCISKCLKLKYAGVHNSFEYSNKTYTTVTFCSNFTEEASSLPYIPANSLLVCTRALKLASAIFIKFLFFYQMIALQKL